jgi:hypothetical protein
MFDARNQIIFCLGLLRPMGMFVGHSYSPIRLCSTASYRNDAHNRDVIEPDTLIIIAMRRVK